MSEYVKVLHKCHIYYIKRIYSSSSSSSSNGIAIQILSHNVDSWINNNSNIWQKNKRGVYFNNFLHTKVVQEVSLYMGASQTTFNNNYETISSRGRTGSTVVIIQFQLILPCYITLLYSIIYSTSTSIIQKGIHHLKLLCNLSTSANQCYHGDNDAKK